MSHSYQLEWDQIPLQARLSMIGITTRPVCSFIDYCVTSPHEGDTEWWYYPLRENLTAGVNYGECRAVETRPS
jgi:hypothetical protein